MYGCQKYELTFRMQTPTVHVAIQLYIRPGKIDLQFIVTTRIISNTIYCLKFHYAFFNFNF